MNTADKASQLTRRKQRVRKRVFGTAERPRLNVFRSRSHIYAQIIDDLKGATWRPRPPWISLCARR